MALGKPSSGYTPIDTPPARAILAAADGRWARRHELAHLAGVKTTSARFYVRALYKAGRLARRRVELERKSFTPYAYEYRLKGT
jgi:hypothetical protein